MICGEVEACFGKMYILSCTNELLLGTFCSHSYYLYFVYIYVLMTGSNTAGLFFKKFFLQSNIFFPNLIGR